MSNRRKVKRYAWLLGINMFISAFTFGGGYVVVPMIRKYFVTRKKLFSEAELIDMAAVAQSSPGAIAINLSVLAGYRVAGISGAVISCIAAVLPSLVILAVFAACYDAVAANSIVAAVLKGMQAGAAALIVDYMIDMCQLIVKGRSAFRSLLVPAVFVAHFVFNIHVALILTISCLLGLLRVWLYKRRQSS
ncbi:chromate transporter [Paenibacillus aquistagni]|uniref:chromate transporter n=1 Tax=Paenibacillus aquistagni TaxID=1852522 RepID=UPI000B4FEC5C|nr:chromate transporter [Paenibacillus aquistagni]NMM52676.1 chromate transporter [Paenibacillus aquistagni]